MHRKLFYELLAKYEPSPEEEVFKKEMLSFIANHPDCFERTLAIGHITASCWLLNHDMSKALLTHHTKLDKWFQLGGHCDGDSDVLAVALKEASEESGIENIQPVMNGIFDIDIHLIPDTPKEKAHFHYDVRFLLQATKDEPLKISHESKSLKWVGKHINELPTQSRSVVRLFNKWLSHSMPIDRKTIMQQSDYSPV